VCPRLRLGHARAPALEPWAHACATALGPFVLQHGSVDPNISSAVLLSEDDPPPFRVIPGRSPFLVTCDHAGNRLPARLGDLGLTPDELGTHIAWDIGAAAVAEQLGRRLDAFVILQTYSRLVIDCNRPLDQQSSIVDLSEATEIPGNRAISAAEAEARARAVFHPYHARIREELERRSAAAEPTVLIAMHSFTPRFLGQARRWHAGVLYHRDVRLAHPVLELLRRESGLEVGDNEPYSVSETSDYGVIRYGEQLGHPYVELEVRQDLIADEQGQTKWAERLARILGLAQRRLA
jgi:predicted N-formylglutamate amidohydrolase